MPCLTRLVTSARCLVPGSSVAVVCSLCSLAARFAHFKKTNKSGVNTIIEEAAQEFELWVNRVNLQLLADTEVEPGEAPLTLTYIPGATPEELFAKCDADLAARVFHGVLHGHDEIAGFFEEMGLYGNGQRTKARQSDLNFLMDKGRPSKIFRDQDKGYGKDLRALHRQVRLGRTPLKIQLLQISGINARDAERILRDDDLMSASLATRERYLFYTAPVENPYAVPPRHVSLPDVVLDAEGAPLQDRAGFRRDLLPRRLDVLQGMQRCYHFVGGLANQEVRFTDAGLEKFRCFDAMNWELASIVQYTDDQLAAELRQVQRHLAVRCAARMGLHVMLGQMPEDADVQTTLVTPEMVDSAALTLACILGSVAVGFRGVNASSLPRLRPLEDGSVDPKLFCRVLAPAFAHFLERADAGDVDPAAEAARQLEAAILGLMRETLTWPGSDFVSKGMVTRRLSAADQGTSHLHPGWQKAQGHSNSARSEWWLANVARSLADRGVGQIVQAHDGARFVKPAVEDLGRDPVRSFLTQTLQLDPDNVSSSLAHAAAGGLGKRRRLSAAETASSAAAVVAAESWHCATCRRTVEAHAALALGYRCTSCRGALEAGSGSPPPSPAPTLRDSLLPPTPAASVPQGELAATAPQAFDPYQDDRVLETLHLAGGADQLALNNLRNIFCLVCVKAGTDARLRAYQALDARLNNEESDICRRIRELLEGGWSDAGILDLPMQSNLSGEMIDIWRQWVDIAYMRAGRVPPPRTGPAPTPARGRAALPTSKAPSLARHPAAAPGTMS